MHYYAEHVCLYAHVEVRKQWWGAGSQLLLWVPGTFTCWATSLALLMFLQFGGVCFAVLGTKPRASHLPVQCSTPEL